MDWAVQKLISGSSEMARPQEFDTNDALEKALQVFWDKGYEGTTLADLTEATGLSKSSLYGTFGDKRKLFLTAYDSYRAARAKQMKITFQQENARDAIASFFSKIIDDASSGSVSKGCMSTNQAVELAPHDAVIRERVESDFKLIETAFANAIKRGQEQGSIQSKQDAHLLAQMLIIAFPGLQVMVRAGASADSLEGGLNMMLSILD